MSKVNYVIASSAHRIGRKATEFNLDGMEILRTHLIELTKTNTEDLAQITLLRIYKGDDPTANSGTYWDIDNIIKKFKCPFIVLNIPHECLSYGAYIRMIQKYQTEFDYYILMEDDYYPVLPDFVSILLKLHKEKLPNGGYLCSLLADQCAAISNGIIDAISFIKAINRVENAVAFCKRHPQRHFSYLFVPNLADTLDEYRSLFMRYQGTILWEEYRDPYNNSIQDLLNPIEYLIQKGKIFPKNKWDKVVWSKDFINGIKKLFITEK